MARKAGVVINETEYCKMDSTLLRTLTASRVMTPRSNHHFLIIMITTMITVPEGWVLRIIPATTGSQCLKDSDLFFV